MKITTNNCKRELLTFRELSQKQQNKLLKKYGVTWDSVESEANHEITDGYFFEYAKELYSLGEFNRISPPSAKDPNPMVFQVPEDHPWVLGGWQGANEDGLGMLIKFPKNERGFDDIEWVIVGKSNGY